MNCEDVLGRLPLHVYGDLDSSETGGVDEHLQNCTACRRELQTLRSLREVLDTARMPFLHVNESALFMRLAEKERARSRRWRRLGIALSTAAALILAVFACTRIEIRLESHQLVARWGTIPEPAKPQPDGSDPHNPHSSPSTGTPAKLASVDEKQIRILSELIHALADDVRELDRECRKDRSDTASRVAALEEQFNRRYRVLEANLNTLQLLSHRGE